MKQKKLQSSSKYNEYDLDGDGIVSDAELSNMKEIKETETALRKNLAQLRMARYTLIAMGVFTAAMFFIDVERVKALADISNLFYLSGAGIVGAYMGTTAWMNKK
jgi:Flp pilus assembly CpaE family ATPase|tara:strand:+ start:275 stop:589 length:315 start_codon:yes stop_codon:yes gene_type:complete